MNVTILNDDPDIGRTLLRRAWVAARTCYSSHTPSQLWDESRGLTDEKMLKVVEGQVIESGHLSVLRHCALTYGIDGISRACAAQLLRHHSGFDWEQQSQRYTRMDAGAEGFVIPPSIQKEDDIRHFYELAVEDAGHSYNDLLNNNVAKEDARYLMPIGAKTNIVGTINFNALINLCHDRLCSLAQWEVRQLVARMRRETVKIAPWIRPSLTIKCCATGLCFETRNADGHCKVRPHVSQIEIKRKETE